MVNEAKWQVTLRLIALVGRFCAGTRVLWMLLAVVACVWFGVLFASGSGHSARLLLPLSLLLWGVLGLCAGYWLAWMPEPVHSSDGLSRKFYKYLTLIAYILLAILVLAVSAGALLLTWRGIGLGAGG